MLLCKYCKSPETSENPVLTCEKCPASIHTTCLSEGLPGGLRGDVFFKLVCSNCTDSGIEFVSRERMSWTALVTLVLYNLNLQLHGSSRQGYFHWKMHICKFISDKWKILFPEHVKKKKTWVGTVSGTLTHHSSLIFKSGTADLKESGWWRLHNPELSPQQIMHLKSQDLMRKREKITQNKDVEAVASVTILQDNIKQDPENEQLELDSMISIKDETNWSTVSSSCSDFEAGSKLCDLLFNTDDVDVGLDIDENPAEMSVLSFTHMSDDSLIPSAVASCVQSPVLSPAKVGKKESVFCSNMEMIPSTVVKEEMDISDTDLGSDTEDQKDGYIQQLPSPEPAQEEQSRFQPMSQFEEVQLMHRLERAGPLPDAASQRLLCKLRVRHAKRQRGLPLFNIDLAPLGFTRQDPSVLNHPGSMHSRVLDRYQTVHRDDKLFNNKNQPFLLRLMGHNEPLEFYSPYTQRLLKPYILRESSAKALWVRLMRELVSRANQKDPEWKPLDPVPLDYSYVRPQHIAPVNSLCREFFWPGIDVTESLQYPDFTCVALYKKLVVGFAFLVPDVGYNEAYISFLLVRPEWRNAGIGSFMLYHLIQSCMGKDVTLHVSATNPALILYQKFGFKVEELVQDFYEKYLSIDSTECRHALFLRLSR